MCPLYLQYLGSFRVLKFYAIVSACSRARCCYHGRLDHSFVWRPCPGHRVRRGASPSLTLRAQYNARNAFMFRTRPGLVPFTAALRGAPCLLALATFGHAQVRWDKVWMYCSCVWVVWCTCGCLNAWCARVAHGHVIARKAAP